MRRETADNKREAKHLHGWKFATALQYGRRDLSRKHGLLYGTELKSRIIHH